MTRQDIDLAKSKQGFKFSYSVFIAILVPLLFFIISLCIGRYPLSLMEVWQFSLMPLKGQFQVDVGSYVAFWHVRFPRALLVLIAGAALSLAGTVLQGIFRNPLVSPDILGVSAGASLGAAVAIVLWNGRPEIIQLCAFSGGLLAVFIAFRLSKVAGRNAIVGLILAGIIINSLASSGVMLLKYLADPYQQLPALEFWIMGGFYTADWVKILDILPALLISTIIILSLRWKVNVLSLGDEEALSLGIRVPLARGVLVAAATILVAAVVSIAGMVSWIGLVAPHVVRMLVGNDNLKTLPLALSVGAVILLLADTIARTATTSEIPISILTSLVGAPFLAYLLWKVGNGYWGQK